MILEITEAEAAVIDSALVIARSEYTRMTDTPRTCPARLRRKYADKIAVADTVRYKILLAKHGAARAAEIAAERATVPTVDELYSGVPANLSGGKIEKAGEL